MQIKDQIKCSKEVLSGISLAQQPENYVPLANKNKQLIFEAKALKELSNFNEHSKIKSILLKYNTATRWLPLKTNGVDMVVLLNNDGEIVKIVDLRPWH